MRIFSSPPESGGVRGGLRLAFLRPLRGTSATAKRKVIKVVIHPNFKNAGRTYNLLKSIGVVEATKMESPQYRQIK